MFIKFIYFFLITSTIFSMTGCNQKQAPINVAEKVTAENTIGTVDVEETMRVLWTVSQFIIGKNASWGEQEASALIFKPLDITSTEIFFNGQVCRDVSFQSDMVNTVDYLTKFQQTTPKTLGITDEQIEVVKTSCALPGFNEYIHLSDNRLIIWINGVFFFFDPAVTY